MTIRTLKDIPRGIFLLLLVLVAGPIAFQSCAISPIMTTENERRIGAEAAKQVEQTMGLVDTPELGSYLEAVGGRLAAHSPRKDLDYTFRIVDMKEPNAFALPGGYTFFSRGLLALVNSEEDLAAVMAHEIAHVTSKHHAKSTNVAILTAPLKIATGIVGGTAAIVAPRIGKTISGIGEFTSNLLIAPYSRQQEREADQVGQELMVKAGWDPNGLARILESLRREESLHRKTERSFSFFTTHPALEKRVAKTTAHAAEIGSPTDQTLIKSHDQLMMVLDGLMVGENPDRGVFRKTTFYQPVLNFKFKFPEKWKSVNTPSAIAGESPKEDALIMVSIAGKGNDPRKVAEEVGKETDIDLLTDSDATPINGLPAHRIERIFKRSGKVLRFDLAWIAHGGHVYQISAFCPFERREAYKKAMDASIKSFSRLTKSDRSKIKEKRLRIVKARKGETLKALAKRVNGAWSLEQIAVANGLSSRDTLKTNQKIKVAVYETYKIKKTKEKN